MPQTIMVVEDDKNINEVVSEYLKDAGYIVLSRQDGRSALHAIEQSGDISLFVFDIMLPHVDGLELLSRVRASDVHRDKPVLLLTALADEGTQIAGFDALADDYITKPFSPNVLVRRVASLLRRSIGSRRIACCDDITIDCDSYQVTQRGEAVRLTLREFELLHALAAGAGRVLTRQQLLNYAWGYDYFGEERIVDVHIKNLRKKLHGEPIITVKGVGYQIKAGG